MTHTHTRENKFSIIVLEVKHHEEGKATMHVGSSTPQNSLSQNYLIFYSLTVVERVNYFLITRDSSYCHGCACGQIHPLEPTKQQHLILKPT